jgi:hypothetical protein
VRTLEEFYESQARGLARATSTSESLKNVVIQHTARLAAHPLSRPTRQARIAVAGATREAATAGARFAPSATSMSSAAAAP